MTFESILNDLVNALNGQVKISNGFRKRSNHKLEFLNAFNGKLNDFFKGINN